MIDAQKPKIKSIAQVKWWRQLRWNLMLFFVVLAVLPIIITTFILLQQTADQNRDTIFDDLETISLFKTQEINAWLARGNEIVELFIEDSTLNSVLNLGLTQDHEESVMIVNDRLNDIATSSIVLDDIFIYDLNGSVVMASTPLFIGRQVSRQPYYNDSFDNDYLIHPPFYDVSTQELALFATDPIEANDGTIIGVVVARYNVETLSTIMLQRTGLGETGETYLVSLENNYLLTPSRSEGYPLTRAYRTEGIDMALSGESGSGVYQDYRNPAQTVYGVYRWIPELEVGFLTEISEYEALAPLRQARDTISVVTVIIAVLAGSIGVGYALRVSLPIITLTKTASLIAEGNLEQRAKIRSQNEIGALGEAFNQMADAVEYRDKVQIAKLEEQLVKVDHAREEAERADQVKSAFLASMSHELRTPLNAIINFSGFVADGDVGPVNDEQEEILGDVVSSAKHLLNLINDVLDMSKIEAGSLQLFMTDALRVNDIITTVIPTARTLLKDKPIEIETELDDAIPPISADKQRITQVLLNLVSNACKFTREGTIKITTKKEDDQIIMSVQDTGAGIAKQNHETIFQAFIQTEDGVRQGGGTGLGLPISKSLIEAHDGKLWVESELGKGSTFKISIPIQKQATLA